jgi:hypothetical protein
MMAVYLRWWAEVIGTGALVLFCTIGLPLAVSKLYRQYRYLRMRTKLRAYIDAELQADRR